MDTNENTPSPGKRSTKSESYNTRKMRKEQNIDFIRRLLLRKISSATDIKKALSEMDPPVNLTERSIYRYKGIIVKRTTLEIEKKHGGLSKTVEQIAYEVKETFEEIVKELWVQYHNSDDPGDKISALKEIRKTTAEQVSKMQSLGLVFETPVKHQLLDKDGKPTNPAMDNTDVLVSEFHSFLKAKYQDPIGSTKQAVEKKIEALPLTPPIPAAIKAD